MNLKRYIVMVPSVECSWRDAGIEGGEIGLFMTSGNCNGPMIWSQNFARKSQSFFFGSRRISITLRGA